MGSIPPELSLDCRPSYVPRTINEFLGEVSMIGSVSERLLKIDGYLRRLEDEMRKIDAFKRELPLCMLLLNDAIVVLKEESEQCRKSNVEPVLEEFIPLKKSCNEEDKVEVKKEKDSKDKMNWMSSVQLWNADNYYPNNEINKKASSKEEIKMRGEEEGKHLVIEDPLKPCTSKNVEKAFGPFKGYSGLPLTTMRKKDKEDLPGVPGLSLRVPGIKNLSPDLGSNGFGSKANGVRGCVPSATSGQSNLTIGPQQQQQHTARKQRRCWSPELHRRFVNALQQLGGSQAATPKQIRELMQVDGLTNDEVKSHLQKYRLHTRRIPGGQTTPSGNQPVVVLGGLWMSQDHYGESSKQQSNSQSGSPEGPFQLCGNSRGSTTGGDSMEEEEDEKSESHSWKSHVQTPGKVDV